MTIDGGDSIERTKNIRTLLSNNADPTYPGKFIFRQTRRIDRAVGRPYRRIIDLKDRIGAIAVFIITGDALPVDQRAAGKIEIKRTGLSRHRPGQLTLPLNRPDQGQNRPDHKSYFHPRQGHSRSLVCSYNLRQYERKIPAGGL